ncbi:hypothetical protein GC194_02885 [bacterium]|nr:hypothetical protein [bacterium]
MWVKSNMGACAFYCREGRAGGKMMFCYFASRDMPSALYASREFACGEICLRRYSLRVNLPAAGYAARYFWLAPVVWLRLLVVFTLDVL